MFFAGAHLARSALSRRMRPIGVQHRFSAPERRVGGGGGRVRDTGAEIQTLHRRKTMPKLDRLTKFADQKQVKTIITTLLLTAGLGGAALVVSPAHPRTAAPVARPAVRDAVTIGAAAAPTPRPVIVTKDSSPQDIVKAIVSQGQAAGLAADQIKTIIATAKIESGFCPTVSGGVQTYGGPGTAADEVFGLFQEKASF